MDPHDASFLKAVGRAAMRRRQERGLTQFDVALACDIQPSYVSAIERGTRAATVLTLNRLSKSLGWPISELFKAAGY